MKKEPIRVPNADRIVKEMAGESMHAKRVLSLTSAVAGVVNAVSLSIHAIGAGLAWSTGLNRVQTLSDLAS